jgi:hypothetical protein
MLPWMKAVYAMASLEPPAQDRMNFGVDRDGRDAFSEPIARCSLDLLAHHENVTLGVTDMLPSSRLVVAVHAMSVPAGFLGKGPVPPALVAESVHTNPVVIRRLMTEL